MTESLPQEGWIGGPHRWPHPSYHRDGAALITLEPGLLGQHRVRPLSMETLMAQMETPTWTIPAGVVIAWGVDEGLVGRTVLRKIACAGAPAFTSTGAPPFLC